MNASKQRKNVIREINRKAAPQTHKKSWPLLRALFSRTTVSLIFLLLQILTLWAAFTFLNERIAFWVFIVLSAIEVIAILNARSNSAYKLAWIVPIIIFPVFGGLFYLFLKLQTTVRKMRYRYDEEQLRSRDVMRGDPALLDVLREEDPALYGLSRYLSDTCGYPAYRGSSASFYPLGDDAIPALIGELKKAKHFIFLEFFIVAKGSVFDEVHEVLREKAQEGVEIRFLYDGMNSIANLPFHYNAKLREEGIDTKIFSPMRPMLASYQNNRDHRKICVIDGNTAFTGGFNLADEYANRIERFGHWKDVGVMIKGEAVNSFTQMFLQMWNSTYRDGRPETEKLPYARYRFRAAIDCHDDPAPRTGFVIPYGDNPLDQENAGENVYLHILHHARDYVHIMTPYLVLDDEMMNALCYAAKRGVSVKILFPHIPDKPYAFWLAHSYYAELLAAGVRIFEYRPGFVHAKEFISDDSRAVIGTINLDFRSLYLHFENAVYLQDTPCIREMEADFNACLSECLEVDFRYLDTLPWYKLLFGSALRLFAPLF